MWKLLLQPLIRNEWVDHETIMKRVSCTFFCSLLNEELIIAFSTHHKWLLQISSVPKVVCHLAYSDDVRKSDLREPNQDHFSACRTSVPHLLSVVNKPYSIFTASREQRVLVLGLRKDGTESLAVNNTVGPQILGQGKVFCDGQETSLGDAWLQQSPPLVYPVLHFRLQSPTWCLYFPAK